MDYKEKIIALLNDKKLSQEQKEKLEGIFPELKESEDERIRKYLKRIIGEWSYDDLFTKGFRKEDIIAWLEKQGEQKSVDIVEPKFKIGDTVKSTFSSIQYYITDVHDYYYTTDTGCVIMFNSQDNFELYEQKPAWSEEDKDFMYDTLSNLTELKDRYGDEYGKVGKCIDWLKSLKDRVQPQPKQEWSEEDKIRITHLISLVEHHHDKEYDYFDYSDLANWLKSLRPQNRWKPSDEQIECLDVATTRLEEQKYDVSVLKELLKQLKKLTK